MHNLQSGERLRPLCKLADAGVDAAEADERHEQQDATEDDEPEEGRDEVVGDEVLRLGRRGAQRPRRRLDGSDAAPARLRVLGVHCFLSLLRP